ncbi:MAG: bifunctional phosphopantothenoylcysteine decarboxylase/phosphopantothenate--cysteine ligase CoaBC [Actinomycetaceae bacterium]|nr:bifunctional phosphopantothenoylcysteine decarboxylase/phosphopantothenate--cysteine ligase CoaBC [Actinomycetaceae bacterium]
MSRKVAVGVCGGIAAYKTIGLVRALIKEGWEVQVIPTPAALQMVGATTWQTLTGKTVTAGLFEDDAHAPHIELARDLDLFVVAPATANTLAKFACGIADNLLTATFLSATCPTVLVPAMHTQMWNKPVTVRNVDTLRKWGITVVEPATGELSSGDFGTGRLPGLDVQLFEIAKALREQDFAGKKVVVSAGGTREPVDPVRWIGNRSSGHMGAKIAQEFAYRGADVTLVAANVSAEIYPAGVRVEPVQTHGELMAKMQDHADADIIVMAAAVADFRVPVAADKIKDERLTLTLEPTVDILRALTAARRKGQIIVGFAAETGTAEGVLELGIAKAKKKKADLLVINQVGTQTGFGDRPSSATIVDQSGNILSHCEGEKFVIARGIVDQVRCLVEEL